MNRKERLLHLYRLIVSKPAEAVNLRVWRMDENDAPGHTCGTMACALGWACMDPQFNAMGLGLLGKDLQHYNRGTPYLMPSPRRGGYYGYWAGAVFFGLPLNVGQELFQGVLTPIERYNPDHRIIFARRFLRLMRELDVITPAEAGQLAQMLPGIVDNPATSGA